tara:strand:- start:19460 stop:20359 length:900 start_codon:yes stop_codon:yes gene_type:complete
MIPPSLRENFNSGKSALECSTAILNPYAKWMQSPNIPRITRCPIVLENIEDIIEADPDIKEMLGKLKKDTQKREDVLPEFFPREFIKQNYFTQSFNNPDRFLYALLSAHDITFNYISETCKQEEIYKFITNVKLNFKDYYDSSIFRLYKKTKSQIYSSFEKNPSVSTLHVISNYIKKNIIILRKYNYEWACIYDPSLDTYCLWEDDNKVGYIRNDKNSFVDVDIILKYSFDIDEERTMIMNIYNNETMKTLYLKLKKMNFEDLKNFAKENNISLFEEDDSLLKKDKLFKSIVSSVIFKK